MIVCIAGKPSVAHDTADILGVRERKEEYIEEDGYQITQMSGYLYTLKEPHEYILEWKSWNLSSLSMIPSRPGTKLIGNFTYEKQSRIIEGLMQQAGEIIDYDDAGQEGEPIQRWVMQKTGARCSVKRLWVSSLTEEVIKGGLAKLKDQGGLQPLYEVGISRAIGDWLLGMNATRLYTVRYGQNRQVLSIRYAQTSALALIVNRQLDIESLQPKQCWELKTMYRDTTFSALIRRSDEELAAEEEKAGGRTKKTGNRGIDPIANRDERMALVERTKNPPFVITSAVKKDGKECAPCLSDLTSPQVECSKKFVYSTGETLKLIQPLYEKKMTTYPRVDTIFLNDDIYPKCPSILKRLKDYEVLTVPLSGTPSPKSKEVFDSSKVTDHHTIIPTGVYPQNLIDIERKIFDLIARRFIAVFYPGRKVSTTTIAGEIGGIELRVIGKQVLEPRWHVVFSKNVKDPNEEKENEEENVLLAFVKGESGPYLLDLNRKWIQPPKPCTETTLPRTMETANKLADNDEFRGALKENGIGRPSTRAAIIETLLKCNHIRKEKKNLIATPTGMELIQLIHEELLKPIKLMGIQEKELCEIEKKTYDVRQFLKELRLMVAEIANSVLPDNTNHRITIQEAVTTEEEEKKKEPKKQEHKPTTPKGKKMKVISTTKNVPPTTESIQPDVLTRADSLVRQLCPLYGKRMIIKGKAAYGCSEWRDGHTYRKVFGQSCCLVGTQL